VALPAGGVARRSRELAGQMRAIPISKERHQMLAQAQIEEFHRNCFLTVPGLFSAQEVATLRADLDTDMQETGPFVIREGKSDIVRAVYAPHQRRRSYADLVTDARLLGAVQQMQAGGLYLYQLKVNTKLPFIGEDWAWHYDYAVWGAVDGLARPDLISVAVFLDDVTEFNGPMVFVPGSHRIYQDRPLSGVGGHKAHVEPDDFAPTTAEMQAMVNDSGLVAPKGKAGSVLFFNASVVHGSATNISPFSRRLAIVTYNAVDNLPAPGRQRADYIVCPPTAALTVRQPAPRQPEAVA
jgi:ectoine hydroxylase